jgi:hypothetical protein
MAHQFSVKFFMIKSMEIHSVVLDLLHSYKQDRPVQAI